MHNRYVLLRFNAGQIAGSYATAAPRSATNTNHIWEASHLDAVYCSVVGLRIGKMRPSLRYADHPIIP